MLDVVLTMVTLPSQVKNDSLQAMKLLILYNDRQYDVSKCISALLIETGNIGS